MAKKPPIGVPQTLYFEDFSGGWVTNPASPSLLTAKEAQQADNVSFDQRGRLSPRKGRLKRFAAAFDTAAVTGLGAMFKKDGTSRLIMATGDEVYYDSPHQSNTYTSQAEWQAPGSVTWNDLKNSGLTWNDLKT